jgi:hypothetical protein
VSEETAGVHPDTGEAEAHVVLDRRVGAPPLPPPTLLFAEAVCPEAYEEREDNLCAPRQIAAILKRTFEEICDALRDVEFRMNGMLEPAHSGILQTARVRCSGRS